MNNKNPISTVVVYAFFLALIYSLFTSGCLTGDAFDWSKFIKVGLIAWLVITALAYVLYLITYPKVVEQPSQNIPQEPSVQFYYNAYVNGYCRVEKLTFYPDGNITSEFNFLNKEGEYISEKWYPAVSDFCEEGVALVTDGEMYNFINNEGKLMSINWFYGIDPFVDGIAKVRWKDNTVKIVGVDGKCLWKDWKPEVVLPNKDNEEENNE